MKRMDTIKVGEGGKQPPPLLTQHNTDNKNKNETWGNQSVDCACCGAYVAMCVRLCVGEVWMWVWEGLHTNDERGEREREHERRKNVWKHWFISPPSNLHCMKTPQYDQMNACERKDKPQQKKKSKKKKSQKTAVRDRKHCLFHKHTIKWL